MKRVLLFVLLSFAATVTYAQKDTTRSTNGDVIHYNRAGFWESGKFTVNGNVESFNQISARLAEAKASAYEFNEYKKYRNLTYYMAGGAIACIVSSLPFNHGGSAWKTSQAKVAFGAGIGFMVPEFIFAGKRNKHFWKAVQAYNTPN
jgi:hypothetical protein